MSFQSDKRFNDFQHFPRGLRRSGEFTTSEAEMLETCGQVMLELYQGKRTPQDDVEQAFLDRVQANDAAGNPHAKVWFKYLKVIGPRRVHRLCAAGGNTSDDSSYDTVDESID
ncbi:MAG: DUF413 domain-containing protein [Aeromonadaceae bacterium]|nr:DUF413 domain-containing protein [Aeromonadaceae bacterium]